MAVLSKFMQKKLMGQDMQASQEQLKQKQSKIKELMKKNDPKSAEELKKVQEEMMSDLNAMTSKNLKYMVVSLPVFLLVFYGIQKAYNSQVIRLLPNFELSWFWYYFLCAILSSIGLGVVQNRLKKKEVK